MAEFCSKCEKEHGFSADINIKGEFMSLKNGDMASVLCEGCAMTAIGKTDDGKCVVFMGIHCPDESKRSLWHYYNLDTDTIGEECKQLNEHKNDE